MLVFLSVNRIVVDRHGNNMRFLLVLGIKSFTKGSQFYLVTILQQQRGMGLLRERGQGTAL